MAQLVFTYPPVQTTPPIGGATAANQLIMIAELQDINAELDLQTPLLTNIETNTANTVTELQNANVYLDSIESQLITVNTSLDSIETKLDTVNTNLTDINAEQVLQTALLTSIDSNSAPLTVVDEIDSTPLLSVALTNIPASASPPVQVVATLAADVRKVISVEDIGEFIGLYVGGVGVETLAAVLPLGGGEVEVVIPAGTRVSLRHMKNTTIVSDFIAINFLG